MKELDSFTIGKLKAIIERCGNGEALSGLFDKDEVERLARIALSVKINAEPHKRMEVWGGGNTWVQCSNQAYDRAETAGKRTRILYERPELNHPEFPDGWVPCTERLPESKSGMMWSKEVAAVTNLGDVFKLSCMGDYWQRTEDFIDSGATSITHWIPLPAEYKPEK